MNDARKHLPARDLAGTSPRSLPRPWSILETLSYRWNRELSRKRSPIDIDGCWASPSTPSRCMQWLAPEVQRGDARSWLWIVTTYHRPETCAQILDRLASARAGLANARARIVVIDDASTCDYRPVADRLVEQFGDDGLYLRARRNLGKSEFWRTYQLCFQLARSLRPELCLFLQDDIDFEPSLVHDAEALWARIDDPHKAVLNLFTTADDEPEGRWIRYPAQVLEGQRVRRTQWFDLCAFMAGRRLFEVLDYRMFPIDARRWRNDPTLSSGVGRQLTMRLFRRANVYQVLDALVFHGAERSLMNPEARRVRPMDNRT